MKWTCADCAQTKSKTQATPCPACCGFTAIDHDTRGRIGAAVVAMFNDPLLTLARESSPDLAASLALLERVAEGERS